MNRIEKRELKRTLARLEAKGMYNDIAYKKLKAKLVEIQKAESERKLK